MRAWKRRQKDKVNGYNRVWKKNNRPKAAGWLQRYRYQYYQRTLLMYAQRNAKRKNLPFNLTLSDIVIPTTCPVLGIPITPATPGGKRDNGRPSIDRRDNNLGYVRGNVSVVSWRANRLKCDASIGELRALVKYMEDGTNQA